MSIELQIMDEDMTDLSVPGEEEAPSDTRDQNREADQQLTVTTASTETAIDVNLTERVKVVKQLYGIPADLDPSKKWYEDLRLNVVHVMGVQDMSSDDVLSFFKKYDPASLEWVNDTSCNVVFDNAQTAANAIAELTTNRIASQTSGLSDAAVPADSVLPVISTASLETVVPDGTWLLGQKHEKAKHLLIRFAKPADKKKAGAGKFSQYYQKYGNPHYGGKKQLMSGSLAEKLKNMSQMEGLDDDEPVVRTIREPSPESPPRKPLGLRMKMRADDEEAEKAHRSNRVVESEPQKKSVFDRLEKRSVMDRIGINSRVIQRNRTSDNPAPSIWSRLSAGPSSSGRKDRSVLYTNIRIKK